MRARCCNTQTLTLTDALGRTGGPARHPQRIVIAGKASGLLVNAYYLFPGSDERLVGYENRMQTSNDFIPLVSAGIANKSLLEVDAAAEQIAPLKPDLVILKTYMKEKLGDPLEQLSIPVVYLEMEIQSSSRATFASSAPCWVTQAGRGHRQVLQRYCRHHHRAHRTIGQRQPPYHLLLQYTSKGGEVAFNIPPAAWLQTQMVEMAGGNPIWRMPGPAAAGRWSPSSKLPPGTRTKS